MKETGGPTVAVLELLKGPADDEKEIGTVKEPPVGGKKVEIAVPMTGVMELLELAAAVDTMYGGVAITPVPDLSAVVKFRVKPLPVAKTGVGELSVGKGGASVEKGGVGRVELTSVVAPLVAPTEVLPAGEEERKAAGEELDGENPGGKYVITSVTVTVAGPGPAVVTSAVDVSVCVETDRLNLHWMLTYRQSLKKPRSVARQRHQYRSELRRWCSRQSLEMGTDSLHTRHHSRSHKRAGCNLLGRGACLRLAHDDLQVHVST